MSYTIIPSSEAPKLLPNVVRCVLVKLFILKPLSVSASSNEAFELGKSVPIPTLKRCVTPPNTMVLSLTAVAAFPIATELKPCTLAL